MNIEVIARIGRGELSHAQNEWKALDDPSVHPQYGLASKYAGYHLKQCYFLSAPESFNFSSS